MSDIRDYDFLDIQAIQSFERGALHRGARELWDAIENFVAGRYDMGDNRSIPHGTYIRADLIRYEDTLVPHGNGNYESAKIAYKDQIDAIPEVYLPIQTHGKWRVYEVADTEEEQAIAWACSECDEVVGCKYNYCPNCGLKMS